LTRRRKVRGKKSKGTSNENQTKKKVQEKRKKKTKKRISSIMCVKLFTPLSCKERKEK
jgi:hypothetical protein